MKGVKERKVVIPENKSDLDLVGVILLLDNYHGDKSHLFEELPEPPKPGCDCIHIEYGAGTITHYYSDGTQQTEPLKKST